jgi:hypothetical protein
MSAEELRGDDRVTKLFDEFEVVGAVDAGRDNIRIRVLQRAQPVHARYVQAERIRNLTPETLLDHRTSYRSE